MEEALVLAETCTAKELPALLKGSPRKAKARTVLLRLTPRQYGQFEAALLANGARRPKRGKKGLSGKERALMTGVGALAAVTDESVRGRTSGWPGPRPRACSYLHDHASFVLTAIASSSPTRTPPQRPIKPAQADPRLVTTPSHCWAGGGHAGLLMSITDELAEAADRVGCSRARSSAAVTASRSALPGSRGKPVVHAVRIVRLATAR